MSTRGRVRVGDIIRIPLRDGGYGYGHVLEEPLVAFLDHRDGGETSAFEDLVAKRPAFTIWVSNRPMRDGAWPVVGHIEPDRDALRPPTFFKQDPISRKLTVTYDGGSEVPATAEECVDLERAAVWEPEHVAERLADHFDRRPNVWVESLRMRV